VEAKCGNGEEPESPAVHPDSHNSRMFPVRTRERPLHMAKQLRPGHVRIPAEMGAVDGNDSIGRHPGVLLLEQGLKDVQKEGFPAPRGPDDHNRTVARGRNMTFKVVKVPHESGWDNPPLALNLFHSSPLACAPGKRPHEDRK